MHCKNFYELTLVGKMMCYNSLSHMSPFFTIEDMCIRLKKLAPQKTNDLKCIEAEMLKWIGKEAHIWISDMLMVLCNMVCCMIGLQIGSNAYNVWSFETCNMSRSLFHNLVIC